jgi:tetratricopeptide (TPR) repeat protein
LSFELDNSIFSNTNFREFIPDIQSNLINYISFNEHKPPPIMHLFCLMYYLEMKEPFQKTYRLFSKITKDNKDYEPWIEFLILLLDLEDNNDEKNRKKINSFLLLDQFNHPWITEGLTFYQIKLKGQSGVHILNLKHIEDLFNKLKFLWWKWRILLAILDEKFTFGSGKLITDYLIKIEKKLENHEMDIFQSTLFNMKARIQEREGKINLAFENYHQALYYAKKFCDIKETRKSYYNLGLFYTALGNYSDAINFFKEAFKHENTNAGKALNLTYLGYSYFRKGDLKASYQMYHEAKDFLSKIDQLVDASGYVELGLGLQEAAQGKISEALSYFNKSMVCFTKIGNDYAKIYLIGNIAQFFYEKGEIDLSEKYFENFLELLRPVGFYHEVYSYYCMYLLVLLDKEKLNQAEEHLDHLQVIAAEHKENHLIKTWYMFALANFEVSKQNFSVAEISFQKIIADTEENGPFYLFLQSSITLAEVKIRKIVYKEDEKTVNELEDILEKAHEIGKKQPTYPTIIYLKLYMAIMKAKNSNWEEVNQLLQESKDLINQLEDFPFRNKLISMIKSIEGLKLYSGDINSHLVRTLQIGSGRTTKFKKLSSDQLGLIIWKISRIGPEVIQQTIPSTLIEPEKLNFVIPYIGPLFMGILGQGGEYHEGIYGPLPFTVPGRPIEALLASKVVPDSQQTDERQKGTNFTLVGILYPKGLNLARYDLEEIIKIWWTELKDLSELKEENLFSLKEEILTQLD